MSVEFERIKSQVKAIEASRRSAEESPKATGRRMSRFLAS